MTDLWVVRLRVWDQLRSMLAVNSTLLSDQNLNNLMHKSEREALIGDLAGQWQLHMYLSEDPKRSLAHATLKCKISTPICETGRVRTLNHTVTIAERSHSATVTF